MHVAADIASCGMARPGGYEFFNLISTEELM